MSEENVDVVARAISAINERDVDAYLSLCRRDIEVINPVAAMEGPIRGEQGIRGFFEGISEAATRFEFEVEHLQSVDEHRVLAAVMLHVETKGGFRQSQPYANLYDLVGGKLSHVRVFTDCQEALKAAGLRD
jgi:ketosteroid isomerase-like protein